MNTLKGKPAVGGETVKDLAGWIKELGMKGGC